MHLMGVEDMAAACGVHCNTIYAWIRKGDLPAVKFGHSWKITEDAFNDWVASKFQAAA